MENFNYWKKVAEDLKEHGYKLPENVPLIKIPDAEKHLKDCYEFCLSQQGKESAFQYTPELTKVAEWLSDNKRTGLLLYGTCGRGKTFLAKYVLPMMLKASYNVIMSYFDMTYAQRNTDEILIPHYIALDDVGTEQKYNDYGTIRHTLDELIDSAEKEGKLIIITSNLTKDELIQFYGERVFDRLCSLTTRILYKGKSFRQL